MDQESRSFERANDGGEVKHETILQTRQHFADIHEKCCQQAETGEIRVNDLERYLAFHRQTAADILAGFCDNTFTFWQYANYLETGECVAFLPSPSTEEARND